mmetsp:Transcript_29006/g.90411  ORF Transcript_29006/g.90411 Transcript_29006/m.90411 type:complete len:260 (-) Transcript_29006:193-972(-)
MPRSNAGQATAKTSWVLGVGLGSLVPCAAPSEPGTRVAERPVAAAPFRRAAAVAAAACRTGAPLGATSSSDGSLAGWARVQPDGAGHLVGTERMHSRQARDTVRNFRTMAGPKVRPSVFASVAYCQVSCKSAKQALPVQELQATTPGGSRISGRASRFCSSFASCGTTADTTVNACMLSWQKREATRRHSAAATPRPERTAHMTAGFSNTSQRLPAARCARILSLRSGRWSAPVCERQSQRAWCCTQRLTWSSRSAKCA